MVAAYYSLKIEKYYLIAYSLTMTTNKKKILFDISHPAHVHFFKNAISILKNEGHQVYVTSRDKDVTLALLDELGIEHTPISSQQKKYRLLGFIYELIQRDISLYKIVRTFKADVLVAIGGTFIAHAGKMSGVHSLVFYDTENAKLQNAITYPFASCVIVPRCYQAWLPENHRRYAGYHELAYLHPNYFTPDRNIALENGLSATQATFLLRIVSWQANHDIGENGWNFNLLDKIIEKLSVQGKVIISTELKLPNRFSPFLYQGNVKMLHHLMAFSRLFIGESATMASECAVLGVPAIYAAETGRGYMDEQESLYSLVTNVQDLTWDKIDIALSDILDKIPEYFVQARNKLLDDTIDVTQYIVNSVLNYPNLKK